ncbi:MAG: hypothetical protein ACFFBD_27315, partial [Candidatus Hodarchaeota archaeon]
FSCILFSFFWSLFFDSYLYHQKVEQNFHNFTVLGRQFSLPLAFFPHKCRILFFLFDNYIFAPHLLSSTVQDGFLRRSLLLNDICEVKTTTKDVRNDPHNMPPTDLRTIFLPSRAMTTNILKINKSKYL